jgi:hypothetical protein
MSCADWSREWDSACRVGEPGAAIDEFVLDGQKAAIHLAAEEGEEPAAIRLCTKVDLEVRRVAAERPGLIPPFPGSNPLAVASKKTSPTLPLNAFT